MSSSRRLLRRRHVQYGAVIAVLTASTLLGRSDPALAQGSPASPSGQPAAEEKRRFTLHIASGNLADAISKFTAQTGIRVIVRSPVTGLQSAGVDGSLTAAEALARMLAGTGLTYAFVSSNAVTLDRAPATAGGATVLPPVQVVGQGQQTAPGADPYADPDAPYKADRLSSSKFTEPILNTPRSVTVLTKEALEDKHATTIREVDRSTAGVTLGSGEGGNAFGDRFFIRGFDARNDVFVDGVRDPGVSVRENFDTEQVEILRGPASSFAGRGTTGGALNIVPKEAQFTDFYRTEGTGGFSDATKRVTLDLNEALNENLALRVNALYQNANVAGRPDATDNRDGIAGALTFKPSSKFTLKAGYSHTELWGRPDFGVPYDQVLHAPVTEGVVPSTTYYGAVNRDFTKSIQNLGTANAEWRVADWLTLENKVRQGHSLLNYIGTIPENPSATGSTAPFSSTPTFFSGYVQLNAQSRYEPVDVLADQPQATFKFKTGPVSHTAIAGAEFSNEQISIDSYTGLTSELTTGPVLFASSGAPIVSVYNPPNYIFTANTPTLTGNPLRYTVNTQAGYVMDTANFGDVFLVNAGVRYDNYHLAARNNTAAQFANSGITSYNVGLTFKPAKTGSVYVAFATSADPVGDELDATSSSYGGLAPTQPTTQIFGPLYSQAAEVGTKWEVAQHLLATAAGFQTTVTNARETAPANLPGYTSGQIVAGAAYRVRGLDFELAGRLTNRWSVLGGLVLMNTAVTRSIVPTNVGLPLANIAPQSFNMLTKYKLTDELEIGGQGVYTSQVEGGSLLAANGGVAYPNPPNPTILPPHWRFDGFAEEKIGPSLNVRLYVQNIFNKTYYDSLYQSAQPFIAVAPGRAFYVSVAERH